MDFLFVFPNLIFLYAMYNYKGYILFIFIYSLGVFLLCKPLQASNFMFCYAFVCEINKKIILNQQKAIYT